MTLTFKVFDDLYVNKDIVESGKDDKDITSFLHLGKILKIGDDTYHDLDEVRNLFYCWYDTISYGFLNQYNPSCCFGLASFNYYISFLLSYKKSNQFLEV